MSVFEVLPDGNVRMCKVPKRLKNQIRATYRAAFREDPCSGGVNKPVEWCLFRLADRGVPLDDLPPNYVLTSGKRRFFTSGEPLAKLDQVRVEKPKTALPVKRVLQSRNTGDEMHDASTIKEFYDSWDWKHVRMEVLLEQGRRCQCCGDSPTHSPNVKIVVDHVKSLRYNWSRRLDKSNLQVLFNCCNMGKSVNETDFRTAS